MQKIDTSRSNKSVFREGVLVIGRIHHATHFKTELRLISEVKMSLEEQQDLALAMKTELFIRRCNQKLEVALKADVFKGEAVAEAKALIANNNLQIRGLKHFNYSKITEGFQ